MSTALPEPSARALNNQTREAHAAALHKQLGARLRKHRHHAGLSQTQTAKALGISLPTWRNWELGRKAPRWIHAPGIAQTLGVPIAALHLDELVLAEVRVSPDTLERVKREGAPAAREAAQRIAAGLEALLLAEATRPPVDLSPGARPKRRRTRAEVLAGIAAAEVGRKRNAAARKQRIE